MSTIDNLSINIKSSATQASVSIDRLTNSLNRLKGVSPSKTGLGTLANQLTKLNTALSSLSGVSKLETLTSSLSNLSSVEKMTGLKSAITQLSRLPELASELDKADMDKFANSIQKVTNAIKPLATEMEKVSNGFSTFPSRIQKLIQNNEKLEKSNKKLNSSYGILGTGIKSWQAKLATTVLKAKMIGSAIGGFIEKSNDYTETLNLFSVSMGEYYEQEKQYAELVGSKLGIDPMEWMKAQGNLNILATGFGVANEKAVEMSRNMTKLIYDLSSLKNVDVGTSITKVTSGFAGELEPMRSWGFDLSQAKLQSIATANGIDILVSDMTQAEKSMLRYYAMMTQVTEVQGDMARTLQNPSNQLRIFKAQLNITAREIGNIFIPALNAILPYAIAVVKVIRLIAQEIANLFNYKLPEVDYSNLNTGAEDISKYLDNATKSAKELKKVTMGFDELNILNQDDGAGAGDATGGVRFDLEMPEYKGFLDGIAESRADEIFNKIKEHLDEILVLVGLIGLGLLAWGITLAGLKLASLGTTLATAVGAFLSNLLLVLGVFTILLGLGLMIYGVYDAWTNGLDWNNLMIIFAGILILVAGLLIVGGKIGAVIGLIIGGIALVVLGVKDLIENGVTTQNLTAIFVGLALIAVALFLIKATVLGVIVVAVGLILAVFMFLDQFEGGLYVVGAFFKNVGLWLANLVLAIGTVILNIIKFNLNLKKALDAIFYNIIAFIINGFIGVLSAIGAVIYNIINFFKRLFLNITIKFYDFQEKILSGVKDIADKANTILGIFGLDIDTSNIEKKLKDIKDKKGEAETALTEAEYKNIGEEFTKGMNTIKYKDVGEAFTTYEYGDVGEAFNTFEVFKEGWDVEAYDAGAEVGANFRDGILDNLKEKFGGDGSTINLETSDIARGGGGKSFDDILSGTDFKTDLDTSNLGVDMSSINETLNTDMLTNQTTQTDKLTNLDLNTDLSTDLLKNDVLNTENSQLDSLKNVDTSILEGTKTSSTEIGDLKATLSQKLDEVKRACENIEINVTKVYGGDGYATGGFPTTGQMFYARENGIPELVGRIGSRTAVANNDQITQGIATAVYDAMISANQGNGSNNFNIYLDGRQINASVEKVKKEKGASIMTGGLIYG